MDQKTNEAEVDVTIAPREPGIYFGLDEQEYHRDPSLGSTDMRKLAKNPADYWWSSWMNPLRVEKAPTPAQIKGTAVHVLVLYGEAEFDKRYLRYADGYDNMSQAEKTAATKEANKIAAAKGLIALNAPVYDNIAIASAMIAKNPRLARSLSGGMNEVSIFWRDANNKIAKKARIDCLKPRGIGDLKSLANQYGRPFERACIDSVTNFRYDVQAKHYMDARAMIPLLVGAGAVHGDHDGELLRQVCASKTWAWQFVFWQSEGAPITFSYIISPQNPILEIAAATLAAADANFIEYMEKFGPHQMWLPTDQPKELYLEDLPPWFGR